MNEVLSGSLAEQKGIKANDFLLEINDARIRNSQDFYLRLVATAAVNETKLRVYRGNKNSVVTFPRIPRTKGLTD